MVREHIASLCAQTQSSMTTVKFKHPRGSVQDKHLQWPQQSVLLGPKTYFPPDLETLKVGMWFIYPHIFSKMRSISNQSFHQNLSAHTFPEDKTIYRISPGAQCCASIEWHSSIWSCLKLECLLRGPLVEAFTWCPDCFEHKFEFLRPFSDHMLVQWALYYPRWLKMPNFSGPCIHPCHITPHSVSELTDTLIQAW